MTTQHLLKAIQWLKKDMNRIFQIILQDRNNPPHERSISLHMYVYEIEGNACSLSEKMISWRKEKKKEEKEEKLLKDVVLSTKTSTCIQFDKFVNSLPYLCEAVSSPGYVQRYFLFLHYNKTSLAIKKYLLNVQRQCIQTYRRRSLLRSV